MVSEDMAYVLVHETGHYLGLGHGTADKDAQNIMFETFTLGTATGGSLSGRERR